MKSVLSKEIVAGIIGLTILLLADGAGARTLTVDDSGGADFIKIQAAINYASAGDTILVYSGTYDENIIILKPLFLQGVDNGWGYPIINSSGIGSPNTITLRAGNSTLEGFTTMGDGFGISVESNNNKITNITVLNKHLGIQLIDASNNIIENNFGLNNLGIYLYSQSYNNTINNNFLSETYENLPLAYMPTRTEMTLTVDDNGGADYQKIQDAINNARAGATILVYSGTYNENVIVNKPLILKGIDTSWGKPIINAVKIETPRGVETRNTITLSAGNSTFDGFKTINGNYGIYVNSNYNIIVNNTVLSSVKGIYLLNSNNNLLSNNTVSNDLATANLMNLFFYNQYALINCNIYLKIRRQRDEI